MPSLFNVAVSLSVTEIDTLKLAVTMTKTKIWGIKLMLSFGP